jgi:hypothetical protein
LNDFGIKIDLPILPGKKLFGKTNNSKKDIELRMSELGNYFNSLMLIPKI